MTNDLEFDIQRAWGKARTALVNVNPDAEEITDLIGALRSCAESANRIGFHTGERELLRMARHLEGRLRCGDYPRYLAS